MFLPRSVFLAPLKYFSIVNIQLKKYHSVFGLQDLMNFEKPENFTIKPVKAEDHEKAVGLIRKYYLKEHVLVKARNIDLSSDQAIEEYLLNVLKQGNSLFGRTEDGKIAGICVSFACSPVDPGNLRNYAFYRQDPNTKDFLDFTAKLQETPNLWELYKQQKIFEIKMLAVLPEYRRQGLATMLTEKSKENALDQGYKVVRMDCINPYDFKIAERCLLQCIVKFPLHKLRSATAPYIKSNSEFNRCIRVYVASSLCNNDTEQDLESLIEAKFARTLWTAKWLYAAAPPTTHQAKEALLLFSYLKQQLSYLEQPTE